MYHYTPPISKLIEELKKIPGIGQKSAQRICFYLLKINKAAALDLARAIVEAREKIFLCKQCHNITSQQPCEICTDAKRESDKICIVEEPFNIYSIEKTNLYHGLYHVLHGNLSPLRGVGPDDLMISSLVKRLKENPVKEVILATSPTTEGNATAYYIMDLIRPLDLKITRIALGLPVGADLDYVDSLTIAKAIEGRTEV